MGKLAIYKYLSFMLLVITVLLAVFTFFALFGGSADPSTSTALALLVYVLPMLIVGNVVMLLVWLVQRRWHWLAIPAFTLLCCIRYTGSLYSFGLNYNDDQSRSGLMIASYNVCSFGREVSGFKAQEILQVIKSQDVAILCMQEYSDVSGDKLNSDSYKEYFSYMVTGREDMVIYSRFPILKSGKIDFGKTNNSGMWADIDVSGLTVRVFNVHLETTGVNRALYQASKKSQQGEFVENNAILKSIFDVYTRGMAHRARQAELVAKLIDECELPVIVCGDFNDVPYSYVYETMLGDKLVDGFRECGKGFMYTMVSKKKKVRIDYILHDKELTGDCYYMKQINYSDHYPVFMKIAL